MAASLRHAEEVNQAALEAGWIAGPEHHAAWLAALARDGGPRSFIDYLEREGRIDAAAARALAGAHPAPPQEDAPTTTTRSAAPKGGGWGGAVTTSFAGAEAAQRSATPPASSSRRPPGAAPPKATSSPANPDLTMSYEDTLPLPGPADPELTLSHEETIPLPARARPSRTRDPERALDPEAVLDPEAEPLPRASPAARASTEERPRPTSARLAATPPPPPPPANAASATDVFVSPAFAETPSPDAPSSSGSQRAADLSSSGSHRAGLSASGSHHADLSSSGSHRAPPPEPPPAASSGARPAHSHRTGSADPFVAGVFRAPGATSERPPASSAPEAPPAADLPARHAPPLPSTSAPPATPKAGPFAAGVFHAPPPASPAQAPAAEPPPASDLPARASARHAPTPAPPAPARGQAARSSEDARHPAAPRAPASASSSADARPPAAQRSPEESLDPEFRWVSPAAASPSHASDPEQSWDPEARRDALETLVRSPLAPREREAPRRGLAVLIGGVAVLAALAWAGTQAATRGARERAAHLGGALAAVAELDGERALRLLPADAPLAPAERLARGGALALRGDARAAAGELEAAWAALPEVEPEGARVALVVLRGGALVALDRGDEARRLLEPLGQAPPAGLGARQLELLGDALWGAGASDAAAEVYRRAAQAGSRRWSVLGRLADHELARGRAAAVLELLRPLSSGGPPAVRLALARARWLSGDLAATRDELRGATGADPQERRDAALLRARIALVEGDARAAAAALAAAPPPAGEGATSPQELELQRTRALVALASGRPDEALALLGEAHREDPRAALLRADALLVAGRGEDALAALSARAELLKRRQALFGEGGADPDALEAAALGALARARGGDATEPLPLPALAGARVRPLLFGGDLLHPREAPLLADLLRAERALVQAELGSAQLLGRLAQASDSRLAQRALGTLRLGAGRYAEAAQAFAAALALGPADPAAALGRARALAGARERKLARAAYDRAIELAPARVEPRLERAALLLEQREYALARADVLALGAQAPPARAQLLLARAAQGLGDLALAQRAYERVLATDPEDAAARRGLAEVQELRRGAGAALQDLGAVDPADAAAQLARAELLLRAGRAREALPAARRARELAPTSLPAKVALARAQLEAEGAQAARATLRAAPSSGDDPAAAWLELLVALERDELPAARSALRRARLLDPALRAGDELLERASSLRARQQVDAAERALRLGVELEHRGCSAALVEQLLTTRRHPEAADAARAHLARWPDDRDVQTLLERATANQRR
ncbi:MAG: tetratricopeptide repeat protein [Planctomycetota bacterium]